MNDHIKQVFNCCKCYFQSDDLSQDALLDKNAIAIVKDLQKLNGLDEDYDNYSGSGPHNVGRRKTIHNLEKARQKKRNIGTLDVAFKKRFFNMNANDGPGKIEIILFTNDLFFKRF